MFKNLHIYLLMILLGSSSYSFGQDDYEHFGCKYVKSNMKMTGFTEAQLQYADNLEFRSDTFDIVNYRIKLDVTDFSTKVLTGQCDIDFAPKMEGLDFIIFDLLEMTVDSVTFNKQQVNYSYNTPFLKINFDTAFTMNDTFQVSVFYHGVSVIDPSGFGGFQFERGYAYNLGIGLASIPHNYGRSWFPCFDNFVERSTYDLDIITNSYHQAYCVGHLNGVDTLIDDKKIYHYRMGKQLPTYLVGVAVSDYYDIKWDYEGMERNIPIQLVSKPEDTTNLKTSFAYLPFAIEALEKWFGPYQWERVGYVLTTNGAMEHATNIAFNDFLGNSGDPDYAMGIMAHELAHHWWGDITTLTTAYDMWIKEGTAEYGRYLFIEHFFGNEKFVDVLKDNQFEVLNTAHIKDDGYRALSGMPLDHTYGTTTYNKGASVIHNLRTYLGDSLFKVGTQSILAKYAYGHIDAEQFKTQLEVSTGKDMTCFFNAWIYNPGYDAFEVDSFDINPIDNEFLIKLYIEQKLHHAPEYYCDVPLDITFYDVEMNKITKSINVSGQFSEVELILPINPAFWTINENQKLNNGQLGENIYLKSNETYNLSRAKISVKTKDLSTDSIFARMEHIWGAPDKATNVSGDKLKISNSHFWNITGIFPENNDIKASFFYNGGSDVDLDFDLTSETEDSIYIVFRENAKDEWRVVEDFKKQKFSPIDGRGTITITGIKAGQYAFANVDFAATSTSNMDSYVSIFPNPTNDILNIDLNHNKYRGLKNVEIYSVLGETVFGKKFQIGNSYSIDISNFDPGLYFLKIVDMETKNVVINKFVINKSNK